MERVNFTIDHVNFSGKFYDEIVKGMINKYSTLYNKDSLHIINKKSAGNKYRFFVYLAQPVYNANMELIQKGTIMTSYTNIEAIQFSSIPINEYYEEYDYSKKNYLQELKDEVDSIMLIHILNGDLTSNDYFRSYGTALEFNLPRMSINYFKYSLYFPFQFENMITKNEKGIFLNKIKECISQWERNELMKKRS